MHLPILIRLFTNVKLEGERSLLNYTKNDEIFRGCRNNYARIKKRVFESDSIPVTNCL